MASGGKVAGAIRSLVNARDLQLERARVLQETLLVLVFMYGSEIMLWKEKERSRVRVVHMTTSQDCLVLAGWIESQMHG